MEYLLSFLEGVITFISPCMLPMLPLYVSYFAVGDSSVKGRTLRNALGFILGFTVVFTLMGAFAAQLGRLFIRYQSGVHIVGGLLVVLLGLGYLGVFRIPFLYAGKRIEMDSRLLRNLDFFSSVLFGIVFSVGWTPCVGAFLGSALMLAASSGHRGEGVLLLLSFSLGLGIPFVLSALLIDKLKTAFDFIKRHYRVVNAASGGFLIVVGVAMMTGWLGRLLSLLSF